MNAWWVPQSILVATLLDSLCRLFRRFDVDRREGDCLPERWISWGNCLPAGRSGRTWRYFCLRLPVYDWVEAQWGRSMGFQQRALFWFEPLGWSVTHLEPIR